MKRYRRGRAFEEISDEPEMVDPNGEWVKYEDVKKAILVYEDWVDGNLTDVECNCQDHMKIKMGTSCVGIGWFCPAHGYKERLSVETQDRITPKCNCAYNVNRIEKIYTDIIMSNPNIQWLNEDFVNISWVCPAHGFKRYKE